ncbi:MAG: ABC transporter permease [Coriobacteriia bacterium]|nr:ABC transporter permease [Coriobacteriia bacterium]
MLKYIGKRLLGLIPVLLGVSILVFLIMQLTPGDPALIMLGPKATATELATIRHQLGLDLPIWQQYLRWITNIFRGDWGYSIHYKQPVLDLILQRFGATMLLTAAAMIIATVFGVLAGVVSATRQYSFADRFMMTASLVGFCLPVFWLGLILQLFFGIRLGWLPVSDMHSPGVTALGDTLLHLILPAFTLAIASMATIARMTRSSMLEVTRQDFIRTAKAKGVSKHNIAYKHALRNSLIPVITVVGSQFGYLLSGEVLLEVVFNWPGLGSLMVSGILYRDFPLVQGTILFVATVYVLVSLGVDLLYAAFDPRITY